MTPSASDEHSKNVPIGAGITSCQALTAESLKLRAATSADAPLLSELAMRSKSYWPYEIAFLRECAEDLRVSPENADGGLVFVAEKNDRIIGFFGFEMNDTSPELTSLFVEPDLIGTGAGHFLWEKAVAFARTKGWHSFRLTADPYAADRFYYRVGCRKIGEVESSTRPGRRLPLLEYAVD